MGLTVKRVHLNPFHPSWGEWTEGQPACVLMDRSWPVTRDWDQVTCGTCKRMIIVRQREQRAQFYASPFGAPPINPDGEVPPNYLQQELSSLEWWRCPFLDIVTPAVARLFPRRRVR